MTYRAMILMISIGPVRLAEAQEGEKPNAIDPKAASILRELSVDMRKVQTFTVEIQIETTMKGPGFDQRMQTTHLLSVSKPDKLALVSKGGDLGNTIICDGKRVYTRQPLQGELEVTEVLEDRELRSLIFVVGLAPAMGHDSIANAIVEALLSNDAYEAIVGKDGPLGYLGLEKIDTTECHKLKPPIEVVDGSCFIFVEKGPKPVIRAVKSSAAQKPGDEQISVESTVSFKEWKFDVEIPAERFEIPVQKDSSK